MVKFKNVEIHPIWKTQSWEKAWIICNRHVFSISKNSLRSKVRILKEYRPPAEINWFLYKSLLRTRKWLKIVFLSGGVSGTLITLMLNYNPLRILYINVLVWRVSVKVIDQTFKLKFFICFNLVTGGASWKKSWASKRQAENEKSTSGRFWKNTHRNIFLVLWMGWMINWLSFLKMINVFEND